MPTCSRCKQTKSDDQFYKDKRRTNGLYSYCKGCWSDLQRAWHFNNKEKVQEYGKLWEGKHKEQRKEQNRLKYLTNKETILANNKAWRKNNPEKARALSKKTSAKQRSSVKGRLNGCMSSNLRIALKGNKSGRHWEDLVKFTVDELKKHLEKIFLPGMTWGNYGTYWEIDHKIPIVVFNFNKPEDMDFRLCWSLKNLQPLEKTRNRRKNSKIENPFQPSLAIGTGG